MRLRKTKQPPERQRLRPDVTAGSKRPAFSYYQQNRSAPSTPAGPQASQDRKSPSKLARTSRRWDGFRLAQIPMLILGVTVALFVVKLLLIGTVPKVVIIGRTAVNQAYVQPVEVYQKAASVLMSASAANRLKLALDTTALANNLQKQFPELEAVSVGLPLLGNTPVVYVAPAEPTAVVASDAGIYAINHGGVVLAKLANVPTGVLYAQDKAGSPVATGHQALPGSTVSFMETVAYQLKAGHQAVTAMTLPADNAYELDVQLAGKPYLVRFNLQQDARQQSGALLAMLAKLGGTNPAQYIDVRVPERVFYK